MTALLYDLIYGIPLCLIAILTFAPMLGAPEKMLLSILVGALSFGVCAGVKYWESRLRFLLPGLILAMGAGILLIMPSWKRMEFVLQNRWVLWILLLSVACFFVGRFVAEYKWMRRGFAVAFLADLGSALFFHVFPNKAATALELFFLVICLVEEVQAVWEKSGYTDRKGHLISVAPFLLAMGLAVYALPAPGDPFDWEFAVQIWRHATEEIKIANRFFHRKSEDYAMIGFSESGDFWGNLQKKDRKVMEISGRADLGAVVYLTGRTMDHFDGRRWTQAYSLEGRDRMLDTLETLSAVAALDPEFLQNYLWRVDVICKYDEFNTKYLFVPLKPLLGGDHLGDTVYSQKGVDLVAAGNLGYGTEYSATYFRLNQGHEQVQDFLKNLQDIDRQLWEQVRQNYDGYQEGVSYEDFLEYRDRILEYDLSEVTLSEELSTYLDALLDGAESDYEKLERLEKMLSSYTYSTNPGKLPEKVDSPSAFLEYFLLELREGYCSHFATAFVLLARSQGIPARLVEGYYVPKGKAGTVAVTTEMAHAWPEAYLKGYGWIAFEPTPGFRKAVRWEFRKTPTATGYEETVEEQEEEEVLLPEEREEEKKAPLRWYLLLLPLVFGILFVIVFVWVDVLLSKKWFAKLAPAERFWVLVWRNYKVLSLLGWKRGQWETLEEFRGRVLTGFAEQREEKEDTPVGKLLSKKREELLFLEDQEKVIYGGREINESMGQSAAKSYQNLMELLRHRKGKWYWWYYFLIISKKKTD